MKEIIHNHELTFGSVFTKQLKKLTFEIKHFKKKN